MGEAKRNKLLGLTKHPDVKMKPTEALLSDTTSVPGLIIKTMPDELINFRNTLAKPENKDLYDLGIAAKDFNGVLAEVAAGLKIRLHGDYDPLDLMKMLTTAMNNRGNLTSSEPYMAAAGLRPMTKDMISQDVLALFDFGESYGTISPNQTGRGPYTICDSCVHSFDCITARACELGKPAIQLENTMKVIDVVVGGKGRMN